MGYRYLYNPGLSKDMLKKITERIYALDEVEYIYTVLSNHHQAKNKGWLRAIAITMICLFGVGLLGFSQVQSAAFMVYLGSLVVVCLLCVLILIYAKINGVDKEIRQFQKALEIGYPELYERFFMK